jgi:hypothetical protein
MMQLRQMKLPTAPRVIAKGLQASVECFVSDEANVWLVGGFFFDGVVLLILLAGASWRRRSVGRSR